VSGRPGVGERWYVFSYQRGISICTDPLIVRDWRITTNTAKVVARVVAPSAVP
jgi:hypothetical protein